jgi:cytochrome c553
MILAGLLAAGFAGCGKKEKEEAPVRKAESSPPAIKVTKGAVKKTADTGPSKENSGQFYYSYNKEKKGNGEGEQGGEEKVRTTLDAYLNIRSPYERVQVELMIKKLSHDFIINCSPCHDDYANGVIGPSLLDKNGTFIYKRVIAFKTGKKRNVLMEQLTRKMSDEQLKKISDEIAAFNKQIQEMRKGRL